MERPLENYIKTRLDQVSDIRVSNLERIAGGAVCPQIGKPR